MTVARVRITQEFTAGVLGALDRTDITVGV